MSDDASTALDCLENLIGLLDAIDRMAGDPAVRAIARAGRAQALECCQALDDFERPAAQCGAERWVLH